MSAQELMTRHLDIWTAARKTRSTAGRGSNNKLDLVGIKKLRELILELAVWGKLVPQDPNDEPASELLKKIAAEKAQLIEYGKIKRDKSSNYSKGEFPNNDLPLGWTMANLHELAPISLIDGDWIESKDQDPSGDIRLIQLADVGVDEFKNVSDRFINSDTFSRLNCTEIIKGDILIARLPSPIGRACIFPGLKKKAITVVDVAILRLHGFVFDRYLVHCINSLSFRTQVESFGKGATRFRISTGNLKEINLAVAPLPEQHRIVAKVDELMAFCDQLEQTQGDNIAAHAQLVEALLATLTDSCDHNELQNNWQRIAAHFDTLFTTEHSIDQLKQTILQLAIMGKLVPQSPSDEPASELLKKIAAEKAQLIKEGKIKKEKPLPEITDEEKPFELPSGWEWVPFNNLINPVFPISYGVLVPGADKSGGVPFIRIADLDLKNPPDKPEKSISAEIDAQYERTRIYGGEILMGVVGSIGKLGVAPMSWAGANIARAICRIKFWEFFNKEFGLTLLQSEFMQTSFLGGTRTLAQPTLNIGFIRASLTPVPPLAEQHRIVAKVDELMAICDTLKTNLQNAQTIQLALADALVESVIGVRYSSSAPVKNEELSMEIKTSLELVPNVQLKTDAVLANIISTEAGSIDAKRLWQKSKMDLPSFYMQLKKEISAGYILKPAVAAIK